METGTIRLSQVAATGRLDATFHLARARVAGVAASFEATMSPELAVATLEALPPSIHRLVKPIARGASPGAAALARAMREHPFTALALIQEGSRDEIARLRLAVDDATTALTRLEAVAAVDRGGRS